VKPSWDNAPSWAQYLFQDSLGIWHWSTLAPVELARDWYKRGAHIVALMPNPEWRETMEKRP